MLHGAQVVLEPTSSASNASPESASSVEGIGGMTAGGELRLLVTAFSPLHKTQDGDRVDVRVTFRRPPKWGARLQMRTALLNRSTSLYDMIYREGRAKGWLARPPPPPPPPLATLLCAYLSAPLCLLAMWHCLLDLRVNARPRAVGKALC